MVELSFAGDAANVASTKEGIVGETMKLNRVVTAIGLTISVSKTKLLAAGSGKT